VADAFPGSSVAVTNTDGWFEVQMHQHGLLRPLRGAELSDGTLRYVLWIAALLTPRPPGLLVLNEPETSLHPDLLPALGRLIAGAATRSQVIVVSHAAGLIDALQQQPECHSIVLAKTFGETKLSTAPTASSRWQWPAR
jgi:predicted ATPase